ncbi:hypothetical protein JK364_23860 [Streptomyces sp. 110]|uniref:Uncharacterized protein n=1 Tax=Streptomyces endocoffeicus TaxID=2898945 RepID=A0ABS1PTG9_9ACTN|nr:hypothetical protein [Streptomyces endocoffeicus]MBL1115410.1 hypothetical protein [Streptomyces endocoffeicus]
MTELTDPKWQEQLASVPRAWEAVGLVEPGWSVEYDGGDGAYRARFTLAVEDSAELRRYNLSEIEFCSYVMALADLAPGVAGRAGIALANASREEDQPETDYRAGDDPIPV